MALYKSVSDQKIPVYARNVLTSSPATGDAANITAYISRDGGAPVQTEDINPTELSATNLPGVYMFDLSLFETSADVIVISASSTTADIRIDPVVAYTMPAWTAALPTFQSLSVISSVAGEEITVYQYDTWFFTIESSLLSSLTTKENLIFVVKKHGHDDDSDSILFVDLGSGLIYIGKAAPSVATAGSLIVNSDTSFTVSVDMSEVAAKIAKTYYGVYNWWLKAIDTSEGNPNVGFTLIKGEFIIREPGAMTIE